MIPNYAVVLQVKTGRVVNNEAETIYPSAYFMKRINAHHYARGCRTAPGVVSCKIVKWLGGDIGEQHYVPDYKDHYQEYYPDSQNHYSKDK